MARQPQRNFRTHSGHAGLSDFLRRELDGFHGPETGANPRGGDCVRRSLTPDSTRIQN